MESFLHVFISGVALGAIYSLLAVAFVIVMKTTDIVHFALGEYLMVGAVVALIGIQVLGLPAPVASLVAVACAAMLGVATDRLVVRPLKQSPLVNVAFAMVAVSILLENAVLIFWRGDTVSFPSFVPGEPIRFLGVSITRDNLMVILTAFVCMTGLQLFFLRTRVGTAMRAVMEDRETAGLMGVRVKSMIALSFAISGIFAAVAGVVIAPITNVSFDMGLILIKVFVAAVIGGLYSIPGAVAGGLLLGVMENFTTSYISSNYRDVIVYSLLILGLLFKPAGLFAWRRAS
jgi:branched-chain amino acid transport system permease protein